MGRSCTVEKHGDRTRCGYWDPEGRFLHDNYRLPSLYLICCCNTFNRPLEIPTLMWMTVSLRCSLTGCNAPPLSPPGRSWQKLSDPQSLDVGTLPKVLRTSTVASVLDGSLLQLWPKNVNSICRFITRALVVQYPFM